MAGSSAPIRNREVGVLALCLALLVVVMVRSAWLSDDGLITFRTLDNFVNGYGLRFNVAERVQSYTHPLWLFVLTPIYFVTREAFYTPIFVSLAISSLAVLVFALTLRKPRVAAATVLGLAASKAFVDYTTSGLETPLSYLLVAIWVPMYLVGAPSPRRLGGLVLFASLAFLNRMDSVLLFAPGLLAALFACVRAAGLRPVLLPAAAGALPALAWLGFALFYYGTPFPNTAYAKLGTGIDPWLLREQGLYYLGHALRFDAVTPGVILLAGVGAVVARLRDAQWGVLPLAAGIGLQLAYVVEVGGDFMMGRFLAVPFFAAVVLLSRLRAPAWCAPSAALACIVVSLASASSPLRSGGDYESRDQEEIARNRGISDERGFYYPRRGLLAPAAERTLLPGSACGAEAERVVVRTVCGELGFEGFTGCRELFLADRCALSDPLLARMPMIDPTHWRVGHYFRRVPRGYPDTLLGGENVIVDPAIRALYDDIRAVTRGPLLARGRLGAIVRLNTGSEVQGPKGRD
jgi:arabinofuranosyltransferase